MGRPRGEGFVDYFFLLTNLPSGERGHDMQTAAEVSDPRDQIGSHGFTHDPVFVTEGVPVQLQSMGQTGGANQTMWYMVERAERMGQTMHDAQPCKGQGHAGQVASGQEGFRLWRKRIMEDGFQMGADQGYAL